MPIIFHITSIEDWKAAQEAGAYVHPSLHAEGFIHCSQDHQVQAVLDRYFAGRTDLLKLVINTDKLTSHFVFDWSPSIADTFPHVYGPINLEAIEDQLPI